MGRLSTLQNPDLGQLSSYNKKYDVLTCDSPLEFGLKKIQPHRALHHFWGLRVRGQHTKTIGRQGHTVGVSKKK